MKWLRALFPGIGLWGYLASAALAASVAVYLTFSVTSAYKNNEIKDLKLQFSDYKLTEVTNTLHQFESDSLKIHDASLNFQADQLDIKNVFNLLDKDFRLAIAKKPLPLDCRPDDVRVSNLKAAIDAANKASVGHNVIPAVPRNIVSYE